MSLKYPVKRVKVVYCRHCGAEIPDDSKYCEKCGNSLEAPASTGVPSKNPFPIDTSHFFTPGKEARFFPLSRKDVDCTRQEAVYILKVGFKFDGPLKLGIIGRLRRSTVPGLCLVNNEVIKIAMSGLLLTRQVRMTGENEGTVTGEWRHFYYLDATFPIAQLKEVKNFSQSINLQKFTPKEKDERGLELHFKGECFIDLEGDMAGKEKFLDTKMVKKETVTGQKLEITLFPVESLDLLELHECRAQVKQLGLEDPGAGQQVSEFYNDAFPDFPDLLKDFEKKAGKSTTSAKILSRMVLLQHAKFGDREGYRDGSWAKDVKI